MSFSFFNSSKPTAKPEEVPLPPNFELINACADVMQGKDIPPVEVGQIVVLKNTKFIKLTERQCSYFALGPAYVVKIREHDAADVFPGNSYNATIAYDNNGKICLASIDSRLLANLDSEPTRVLRSFIDDRPPATIADNDGVRPRWGTRFQVEKVSQSSSISFSGSDGSSVTAISPGATVLKVDKEEDQVVLLGTTAKDGWLIIFTVPTYLVCSYT